jgi:hypothetical protein
MIKAMILTFILLGIWAAAEVLGALLGLILFPGAVFLLIYYGIKNYESVSPNEPIDRTSTGTTQHDRVPQNAAERIERSAKILRDNNRRIRRIYSEY